MAKRKGKPARYNAPRPVTPKQEPYGKTLKMAGDLHGSRSARLLDTIRRDMQLKDGLFKKRRRNEEVLSLSYLDGPMTPIGGGDDVTNLRVNALNLPYRYARWVESQSTSKKMVVKVSRDAGEGQVTGGGPDDSKTGMWQGITLIRAAYEGGFNREMPAVIAEVLPRGTSVMRIGYHEEAITLTQAAEVGKDGQSVVADVLGAGDLEAKEGQGHGEISKSLLTMAQDPMLQTQVGREGIGAILERKDSHDQAEFEAETQDIPKESTRLLRHKVWMQKKRVGEDVGWSPHVYDIESAGMWWERHVWTVAEVKASSLFSQEFKDVLTGMGGRNESGVFRGGKMPSTESMGSDARHAQGEDALEDDERFVEWFEVWLRRPDMKSGGVRKIVSAEWPDEFCEADEANPHVFPEGHPHEGFHCIPGFFPFFDFTPILSSLPVPERTCGIPPVAVGMPQFEQIAELNRLVRESALRHSLRLYELHPALKGKKALLDALRQGKDGYAYVAESAQLDATSNKVNQGVTPIQFSGNTLDIERLLARLEGDWVKVQGMPPAILQGMGTAETASQDNQGIAAGERESGALVAYFERRFADVLAGMRGLIRCNYDDEDFQALLGSDGAAVMKEWQTGTVDDGDAIHVTFGADAQAQETVQKKQLMEAINLLMAQVDPITGMQKYDLAEPIEELHRRLDLGPPKTNASLVTQLQQTVLMLMQKLQPTSTSSSSAAPGGAAPKTNAGPNPSEGNGSKDGNLAAGAARGTVSVNAGSPS